MTCTVHLNLGSPTDCSQTLSRKVMETGKCLSVSKLRSLNPARFTTSQEDVQYKDIVALTAQSPPSSGMSRLVVHITVDDGRRKFRESFGLLIS